MSESFVFQRNWTFPFVGSAFGTHAASFCCHPAPHCGERVEL